MGKAKDKTNMTGSLEGVNDNFTEGKQILCDKLRQKMMSILGAASATMASQACSRPDTGLGDRKSDFDFE